MTSRSKSKQPKKLIAKWQLSPDATFGSAVRAKGILLEVRARLPFAAKKHLDLEAGVLTLRVPENSDETLPNVASTIATALETIADMPVIPREVEDILTITTAERYRWLKDGRLQSAGTRTVKLTGRARRITFHVFDPRYVEDVLDRDLTTVWREDDAIARAHARRRAAGKAALTRAKKAKPSSTGAEGVAPGQHLEGWEDFDADGFLR